MTLIVYVHLYLMGNSSYTVVCPIDIPDHYWSFQFLQSKSMSCYHLSIHKYPCCATVQECFYCYAFVHIHLFYSNIQPHFSLYFKHPFHFSLFISFSCYTFWSLCLYTVLLYFSFCGVCHFSSVPPLLLTLSCEDLRFIQGGCLGRTQ